MFNVNLKWNPDHIIKIFKNSLFDIVNYSYEFLDEHYILKIKYTSTLGLSIKPVMVKHPRHVRNCMALFFTEMNTDELIIDTRTTNYCDFVDYIKPHHNDVIQRQEKYWEWLQYFHPYVVDFSIHEKTDTYILSVTHGADVIIAYDNQFTITKLNLRSYELMAYVKDFEIPKLENLNVIYNIM